MAGRPKKEDSRDKQYRVRLNDEEDGMLEFAAQNTGVAKSEIFRNALRDYYHNLRLQQYAVGCESSEDWEDDRVSLKRVVDCPHCGTSNRIDLADKGEESIDQDRQMGPETLYSFEGIQFYCDFCKRWFQIDGYISEYPLGALNHEEIRVSPCDDEDEYGK